MPDEKKTTKLATRVVYYSKKAAESVPSDFLPGASYREQDKAGEDTSGAGEEPIGEVSFTNRFASITEKEANFSLTWETLLYFRGKIFLERAYKETYTISSLTTGLLSITEQSEKTSEVSLENFKAMLHKLQQWQGFGATFMGHFPKLEGHVFYRVQCLRRIETVFKDGRCRLMVPLERKPLKTNILKEEFKGLTSNEQIFSSTSIKMILDNDKK
ncbi:unnamed protein product [Lepeophtheirus salmonis]|uniref:(salmon louse) hypothetical protein n=1 Tax=Lepeophtheirus salmonis TaxID=72036 RepID=A0A7R8H3Y8_LEPSM|nr:unnamed protein product [Lepeophtheirus salmonis]CAF2850550.1 unnamed protein product [Lepeophtheirus salmonis]